MATGEHLARQPALSREEVVALIARLENDPYTFDDTDAEGRAAASSMGFGARTHVLLFVARQLLDQMDGGA